MGLALSERGWLLERTDLGKEGPEGRTIGDDEGNDDKDRTEYNLGIGPERGRKGEGPHRAGRRAPWSRP